MSSWVVIVTERDVHPPRHGCDARIARMVEGFRKLGFKVCLVGSRYGGIEAARHLVDELLLADAPLWDWTVDLDKFDAGWYFGAVMDACKRHPVRMVMAEYVWMAEALKVAPEGVVKAVDTHDLMHVRKSSYRAAGVHPWLSVTRREEAELLRKADVVVAIQAEEAEEFRDMVPDRKVVTLGHWCPDIRRRPCDETTDICMVVGSDNPSNVHGMNLLLGAWPEVMDSRPGVELRIYGGLADKFPDQDGVCRYGFVKDLERAYCTAKVVVNPVLLGSGLKIKTVEAMARGKAVVTTPCGASGIKAGVRVCSDLARGVVEMLDHHEARRGLEGQAERYAKRHFSLENVFKDAIEVIGKEETYK